MTDNHSIGTLYFGDFHKNQHNQCILQILYIENNSNNLKKHYHISNKKIAKFITILLIFCKL